MNINKYISNSGYCSRRAADRLIKAGKVRINEKIATLTCKVNSGDKVYIDGRQVGLKIAPKIYLAFNKPYGVISTSDQKSSNTIMNYIKIPERVYPVGRLDVKSTGLILLTNDGDLTQLVLKSKTVEKEYLVRVDRPLTESFLNHLRNGIKIDGRLTMPAKANKISSRTFSIILLEGRKRQIRRMCEKFHYQVVELQRVRIGKIQLSGIPEGKFINLDPKEIYSLLGLSSFL